MFWETAIGELVTIYRTLKSQIWDKRKLTKGNTQSQGSETEKYSHESLRAQNQEWECWNRPAAICLKLKPSTNMITDLCGMRITSTLQTYCDMGSIYVPELVISAGSQPHTVFFIWQYIFVPVMQNLLPLYLEVIIIYTKRF
jgi:hypothetical protein